MMLPQEEGSTWHNNTINKKHAILHFFTQPTYIFHLKYETFFVFANVVQMSHNDVWIFQMIKFPSCHCLLLSVMWKRGITQKLLSIIVLRSFFSFSYPLLSSFTDTVSMFLFYSPSTLQITKQIWRNYLQLQKFNTILFQCLLNLEDQICKEKVKQCRKLDQNSIHKFVCVQMKSDTLSFLG